MKAGLRIKPYYPIKKVKNAVRQNKFFASKRVKATYKKDFGWKKEDVKKALLKLNTLNDFYISDTMRRNPPGDYIGDYPITLDYYKAKNLLGEKVFLKFYFNGERLILDSLKKL
jgi:hypothetical protein